jgi:hypothetical protein
MLKCVSQGKPWAKLSWPIGPKTRLHLHSSFREMPKLPARALKTIGVRGEELARERE